MKDGVDVGSAVLGVVRGDVLGKLVEGYDAGVL